MIVRNGFARFGDELRWAAGAGIVAGLRRRGVSYVIGFGRVRPPREAAFAPTGPHDITPRQLDGLLSALKRWRIDLRTLDDVPDMRGAAHQAVLTFDGRWRDVADHALPVLTRHRAPFALYVPTGYPDGIAQPHEPVLEQVIAQQDRVALVIAGRDRRFVVNDAASKLDLYRFLESHMRGLPPDALATALGDLCGRYGVDAAGLTRTQALRWSDIDTIADSPLATFASATVHGIPLARLEKPEALRELTMGRAVLETALRRSAPHVGFPSGEAGTFTPAHVEMARDAGFVTAATALPGPLAASVDACALPRLMWDNRAGVLRALRMRFAGY